MVGRSSEVAAAVEGDDKLLHQKTIDIPFRTSAIRNLCTGLRIICIELYHQFQLGIFTTRRDAFPNLQPTTQSLSPPLSAHSLWMRFSDVPIKPIIYDTSWLELRPMELNNWMVGLDRCNSNRPPYECPVHMVVVVGSMWTHVSR